MIVLLFICYIFTQPEPLCRTKSTNFLCLYNNKMRFLFRLFL